MVMLFYDERELIKLMEAFYTMSGIRVGLNYINGQNFFTYPDSDLSPFCSIVRYYPEITKKCSDCDQFHMEECKRKNTPIVYDCHLGLTEVIAPFIENNIIICYFMFGQFLVDEKKEQRRLSIYNKVKESGIDVDDDVLKNAIESIHCISDSKLKALVTIFEAIISRIIKTKVIDYSNIKFINNLNKYIDAHISESINVKGIYEYLNISRSFLYKYSKKYLDCNLNTYILTRKINHARNMLADTRIKIKELPQKTGFSDYHYFARIFKKMTGVSPRAYRQVICHLPKCSNSLY